jgi:hypothetical protein
MKVNIELSKEELEISSQLYNKRMEYLIQLGKVKLSEIENEKIIEETYFNLTELNTREHQFMSGLSEKYGPGSIDLSSGSYIKHNHQ